MFGYLKGYILVYNIKVGVEYPATMIATAVYDEQVVPAPSLKSAAELQQGNNSTLIRIETDTEHGARTPISKTIEQKAEVYGFTQ